MRVLDKVEDKCRKRKEFEGGKGKIEAYYLIGMNRLFLTSYAEGGIIKPCIVGKARKVLPSIGIGCGLTRLRGPTHELQRSRICNKFVTPIMVCCLHLFHIVGLWCLVIC